MQKFAFVAACCFTLALPALAQSTAQPASAQAEPTKPLAYEVVSIRAHKSGENGGGIRGLPDGVSWENVSLAILVKSAYDIHFENQVVGLPNWTNDEHYDITAKEDTDTAEKLKTLPRKKRWAAEQQMQRGFLADRCSLKAHREIRDLPVYELVIAKGGLKMKEASPDEPMSERMTMGQVVAHARTVDAIADEFPNVAGRLIIDKTGLEGKKFDYEFKWTEDDRHTTDDSGPSFFTALEEQLGLKLVPAKAPVNILIIDHIERPTPN